MDNPGNKTNRKSSKNKLRGGTQGGATTPATTVGGTSGGTNSLSPAGASEPDRGPAAPPSGAPPRSRGTRNASRGDPEELFEGTRKASPDVAKQKARDAADTDTTHGLPAAPGNPRQHDETDPTGQSFSSGAAVTKGSTAEGSEDESGRK
jgi:hypothetical protein